MIRDSDDILALFGGAEQERKEGNEGARVQAWFRICRWVGHVAGLESGRRSGLMEKRDSG